jgi:hypothetical protein
MSTPSQKELEPDELYRDILDSLVAACREGQGQIAARRARSGVWNANATRTSMPEQHEMNLLLSSLTESQRETLAQMLIQQFVAGVHATLVTLHDKEVTPFDAAYEGSPFHDFMGRLDDWPWPTDAERVP